MSGLTSPLLIPPRLQAAILASQWQASIVHLEQAYYVATRLVRPHAAPQSSAAT